MPDYGFNFMNTKIYIDNESTICIEKNLVFHSKTKHIEIRHYFIRDSYEKRLIQVIKIHTDHNVADLLTKAFDVSSDEFGVKTGSFKVNVARQDLVLLGENLKFVDQHNMVACLERIEGNADFHQIVDFLNASTISMLAIQAVEGEGSGQPSEPQPTPSPAPSSHEEQVPTVTTSQPQKTQTPRQAKRGQDTEIPQSGGPPEKVGDEAVHKELGGRVERVATTAASLDAEHDSGGSPRFQEAMGGTISQTRFERVPTPSYDSPLLGGNTPGSDEERLEQYDLADNVTPTPH
ncbi:hypothetical protein Tco_1271235, partial [Tanacetum coccineum]